MRVVANDLQSERRVAAHGSDWEMIDQPIKVRKTGQVLLRSVKTECIFWWDVEAIEFSRFTLD